jgi:hypothetical protein
VMREAAMPAKRDGSSFLIVTAPEVAPANRAQALEIKPYIYRVEALDVVGLRRDRFGRIISFSHLESRDDEEQPVVRTLTAKGWIVVNSKDETLEQGEFPRPYSTAPVVEIRTGARVRGATLPRSSFVSIARAGHRLFNLCSELDEIFRAQTFSILIYPSTDLKGLTLGVNNALGFDGEGKHAPAFIAPPDAQADIAEEAKAAGLPIPLIQPQHLSLDPAAASLRVAFERRGVRVEKANNDVIEGIKCVAGKLAKRTFRIHKRCTQSIREMGAYVWDAKAQSRGEDAPLKTDDHTQDRHRYALYKPAFKPDHRTSAQIHL